jgi:hypothetical protein
MQHVQAWKVAKGAFTQHMLQLKASNMKRTKLENDMLSIRTEHLPGDVSYETADKELECHIITKIT